MKATATARMLCNLKQWSARPVESVDFSQFVHRLPENLRASLAVDLAAETAVGVRGWHDERSCPSVSASAGHPEAVSGASKPGDHKQPELCGSQ